MILAYFPSMHESAPPSEMAYVLSWYIKRIEYSKCALMSMISSFDSPKFGFLPDDDLFVSGGSIGIDLTIKVDVLCMTSSSVSSSLSFKSKVAREATILIKDFLGLILGYCLGIFPELGLLS
jgi:hypothetical protein